MQKKKRALFSQLQGEVLEIGPGTGVNFKFLPNGIRWKGIEPNPAMHPYLIQSAQESGFDSVEILGLDKSSWPVANNSQDFVISTLVLCSVPSVIQCLNEIHRVLKPGGQFIFIEHVVDHHNHFRKSVQKSVPYTPWRFFSDGCNPGRDIAKAISGAEFSETVINHYNQEGEGVILAINRPHIYGTATK